MNWSQEIDKITMDAEILFSKLGSEQLSWKSNSQTWSIAQNMEHLIVVNETYYPVLASLKEVTYKTPLIAKIGCMVSFLGKIVLKAVQPDRQKKMKTFPIWEPGVNQMEGHILERFEKHQKELKQKIEDARELLEIETIISSPANRNIVYKLETAFDIIVTHEKRHLEQAKEVLRELEK